MRRVINPQLQFGEQDISAIELDPKSRDDIPQILRGLQYIYVTPEIRERVFAILTDVIPTRQREDGAEGKADAETGRPGMEQWKILVLGALRQGLNADYDRIQELANQQTTIRQMLGHGDWADETRYPLQTLKDNLRLFTPEILDRINQEVVRAGHQLVKKSPHDDLHARVDSFVVKTDVHFPTDINLLYDAVRKAIETMAGLCDDAGLSDWRQSAYNIRQFKKAYRHVQRLRHSTSKDADKREARQEEIEAAYAAYLGQAEVYLMRLAQTRITLRSGCALPEAVLAELDDYIAHAERQIDQIRRRVLRGETIPHVREGVLHLRAPHRVDQQRQGRRSRRAGTAGGHRRRPVPLHPAPPGHGEHHRRQDRRGDHARDPRTLPGRAHGQHGQGLSQRRQPRGAQGHARSRCSTAQGQALAGEQGDRIRSRIHPPAPPALGGRIGHQRPGSPWPGHLSRSRHRRLQALRRAGGGGAQHAAPRRHPPAARGRSDCGSRKNGRPDQRGQVAASTSQDRCVQSLLLMRDILINRAVPHKTHHS